MARSENRFACLELRRRRIHLGFSRKHISDPCRCAGFICSPLHIDSHCRTHTHMHTLAYTRIQCKNPRGNHPMQCNHPMQRNLLQKQIGNVWSSALECTLSGSCVRGCRDDEYTQHMSYNFLKQRHLQMLYNAEKMLLQHIGKMSFA